MQRYKKKCICAKKARFFAIGYIFYCNFEVGALEIYYFFDIRKCWVTICCIRIVSIGNLNNLPLYNNAAKSSGKSELYCRWFVFYDLWSAMNADEKVFGVLPLALPLVCVGTNNSYALKREKSYKSNLLRYIPRFYWVLRNKLPPLLVSRLPILVRLILSKYHAEWDNKNYLFWQQPQQHNINNIARQSTPCRAQEVVYII